MCPPCDTSFDETARCIAAAGATMYGHPDCQQCQAQLKLFKASLDQITYVDCAREKQQCKNEGVRRYPTWIIEGRKLVAPTIKSIEFLTGCGVQEDDFKVIDIEV